MDKYMDTNSNKTPDLKPIDDINALSDNKVDVEIEPDVKANRVAVQICSCSLVFNCFSK